MKLALLLLAALQSPETSPEPGTDSAPSAVTDQSPIVLQFLFFRLSYFREAAELRRCDRAAPDRTRALDARFEALRRQLVERYGAAPFQAPSGPQLELGPDGDCRMGVTLLGYENALNELERRLSAGTSGK